MKPKQKNYAFIDAQNLNLGIRDLGWKLDWKRFRVYLQEKYDTTTAYLFIGFLEENQDLYLSLQKAGYILIFKELLKTKKGDKVKGNVDAELVLQAMIDLEKYQRAVIVTGDGDFACLIRYLHQKGKLQQLIVPNQFKYSALLKKVAPKKIEAMNSLKRKLEYKNREPLKNDEMAEDGRRRNRNRTASTERISPKEARTDRVFQRFHKMKRTP